MIKKVVLICTTLILLCGIIFFVVYMKNKEGSFSKKEIEATSIEEIRAIFKKYNEKETIKIKSGESKEGVIIIKWSSFPYCTEYEVEYENDNRTDFRSTTIAEDSYNKKGVSQIRIPVNAIKYQEEMYYFKVRPCVRVLNEQGEEEVLTGNWSDLYGVNSY